MKTNPVRGSLRDGWRTVRRYPAMWAYLGVFGFGYAAFQMAVRWYFSAALPLEERPIFLWARSAFRMETAWWFGTRDSLWHTPPHAFQQSALQALLPALESTAGLFNSAVATFPLAAIAAILLVLNWRGKQRVLCQALIRRFGGWGWAVHLLILVTAIAAIAKPVVYALPQFVNGALWFQWSPVIVWLGFLFEYLLGIFVQVYVILLGYCWVRGLSFDPGKLRDFALRRSSFVFRWSAIIMLLSTLFIDVPLILKNFEAAPAWFRGEESVIDQRLVWARVALGCLVLLFASVQIILTFHSESLRRALRDHFAFLKGHLWPFGWFIIIAAAHFFFAHFARILVAQSVGEGTAPWVAWSLMFPWLQGCLTAWLLASWVSIFKRCDAGRGTREWVQF